VGRAYNWVPGEYGKYFSAQDMAERPKIYTVSQLNGLIKEILENNLPGRLTVKGEISDWKLHQGGHCYFLLKDEHSQLPCVMWKSRFAAVKFEPENGLAVFATGSIDVYPPQGKYQFYVESMQPAGVGALQLALEQMVKRLQAEGLFDAGHKKPLPPYPERIGILTSESGAALYDIVDSIYSRWPCVKLFLYPVPVQGEGAADAIAAALRTVNRCNKRLNLDLLIVGRGGGSLEDLWAFNEEVLARAIYDSRIPVISAVGHEVDTTIADLVADARASTPTKAGVVAVPDKEEVQAELTHFERRLASRMRSRLELGQKSLQLVCASAVFRNPLLPVLNAQQQMDELQARLVGSLKELLGRAQQRLSDSYEQIVKIEPHRLLGNKKVELAGWESRALAALTAVITGRRIELVRQAGRLETLNPKSVLNRGYSITSRKETGLLVRQVGDVEPGDLLVTELAGENLIESKVTKK
jgi:exodeoxyribonuclease VII large subunit